MPRERERPLKGKIPYSHSPEAVAGFLLYAKDLIVVFHVTMVTFMTPV
jgi:hypothetical protein